MNTSHLSKAVVALVLLSMSAPAVFADDNYGRRGDNGNHGYYGNRGHNKHNNNSWNRNHRQSVVQYKGRNAYKVNNNNWKWEQHNWAEQRAQMRANWQRNNANRLSRLQQQQLDEQMKAQFRSFHHNNWNGQYTWNQYSDPQFLDYLHSNSPSLLTSLRMRLGF